MGLVFNQFDALERVNKNRNMKKAASIREGWVIIDMTYGKKVILDFTFKRTRGVSIAQLMNIYDTERTNWRKLRRQGYKCVKATRAITIT